MTERSNDRPTRKTLQNPKVANTPPAPAAFKAPRKWVIGALGGILLLAILLAMFSMWMILRPH